MRILRKMCRYITGETLQELCLEPLATPESIPFPAQISEVLTVALDNEDDIEAQLSALNIIDDLLAKSRVSFDEQFTRLGIPTKILHLAKDTAAAAAEEEEEGNDETDARTEAGTIESEVVAAAVKKEVEVTVETISVVPPEGSSVDKEGGWKVPMCNQSDNTVCTFCGKCPYNYKYYSLR